MTWRLAALVFLALQASANAQDVVPSGNIESEASDVGSTGSLCDQYPVSCIAPKNPGSNSGSDGGGIAASENAGDLDIGSMMAAEPDLDSRLEALNRAFMREQVAPGL